MSELEALLDLLLKEEPEEGQQDPADTAEEETAAPAPDGETAETAGAQESGEGQEEGTEGVSLGELLSLMDTYKTVVGEIRADDRARLIKAVRPFLSDTRQARADTCLKILSLLRFMEHREEFSKLGNRFLPV